MGCPGGPLSSLHAPSSARAWCGRRWLWVRARRRVLPSQYRPPGFRTQRRPRNEPLASGQREIETTAQDIARRRAQRAWRKDSLVEDHPATNHATTPEEMGPPGASHAPGTPELGYDAHRYWVCSRRQISPAPGANPVYGFSFGLSSLFLPFVLNISGFPYGWLPTPLTSHTDRRPHPLG